MPKESLPHDIEMEVISVYTIKSIFDEIKKTYIIESYTCNMILIEIYTFVSYMMGIVKRDISYILKGL